MLLTRSEPILFERQDRTQIYTPPVTRGQMREVLDLDRKETADMSGRRGQQVAIFLRNAQWLKADGWTHAGTLQELLDSLTLAEEIDILHAITAQHHGLRPEDAVAVQQAMRDILKKKTKQHTADELLAMHDEQTIELARLTHRLPAEIDAMPYLDSLTLISDHYKSSAAERKWQAALAGVKLK